MIKNIIYLLLAICLLALGSCSHIELNENDVVSGYTTSKIKAQVIKTKTDFELHDAIGKRLSVYSTYHTKTPSHIKQELDSLISSQIKQYKVFPISYDIADTKKIITNPSIAKQAKLYFATLTDLSVSDKNLAFPISKQLKANSFLVFTIVAWPCESCFSQYQLYEKLQLVNVQHSSIVWTASSSVVLQKTQLGQSEALSKKMAHNLLDVFYHTFKRKWHKKRYHALQARTMKAKAS